MTPSRMSLSSRIVVYAVVLAVVWQQCLIASSPLLGFSRAPKKNLFKTTVYTYGLTVAEVKRDPFNGRMLSCKLSEITSAEECAIFLEVLGFPVRQLCAKKMMKLIVDCRRLTSEEENISKNVGDDTGIFDGVSMGIYPGTKWCGSGHRAENYFDLGSKVELDRCCRAHDHCPIKIRPWGFGYGEQNWSFYTKSHCDCDIDFLNCLIEADSAAADTVGILYFNTMKVPCLREVPGVKLCPPIKHDPDVKCPTAELSDKITLRSTEPEYVYFGKNRPKVPEGNSTEQPVVSI